MFELSAIWQPHTQQRVFRHLLDAVAHPGRLVYLDQVARREEILPALLAPLVDGEVTLADPDHLLPPADVSLLQAGHAAAQEADYIVCAGAGPPQFEPRCGTLDSPEHSATLIIRVSELANDPCGWRLTGPGIREHAELAVIGLHPAWLEHRNAWVSDYPRGVDLFLVDDRRVCAVPRTTQVEVR